MLSTTPKYVKKIFCTVSQEFNRKKETTELNTEAEVKGNVEEKEDLNFCTIISVWNIFLTEPESSLTI